MKYGTVVKVKSGFFEGTCGWVVDQINEVWYIVKLKLVKNESEVNFRETNFHTDNLEITDIKRID